MYRKGHGDMRSGYNPPPGYDGNRFVRSREGVTAKNDGDFTLSVDGIPHRSYRNSESYRKSEPELEEECCASDIGEEEACECMEELPKNESASKHSDGLFSLFGREETILVLLCVLLAGERDTGEIVMLLALLLGIK